MSESQVIFYGFDTLQLKVPLVSSSLIEVVQSLQGHYSACKGTPRNQQEEEWRESMWIHKSSVAALGFLHIAAAQAA